MDNPTGRDAGGGGMPGGLPPEVAAAMPQGGKRACPRCNEIPVAGALVCEACGEVLVPPQAAPFGAPSAFVGGDGAGDEPAIWHLRAGCYILDSLICIPLIIIPFGGIIYTLFRDCLANGQSFGKRAGDVRVVDETTGAPCTAGQSFLRNLFIFLPIVNIVDICLLIFSGNRLGDRVAGTKVVRPRALGPQPRWGLWVALVGGLFFVMIMVAVMGIIAAIVVPNFVKARNQAVTRACYTNQKLLTGATEMYLLDKNKKREDVGEMTPAFIRELQAAKYLNTIPQDPGQGPGSESHYRFGPDGNVTCTIHGAIASGRPAQVGQDR